MIAFTTEKQEQTYSPEIWNNKFKSVYFTKWNKKYDESFKKKTVEIDISGAKGKDFYVGFHNCDCYVKIYNIWFK